MGYRDDLEAAQHRIHDLEQQVRELKGEASPPPEPRPEPPRKGRGAVIFGVPVALLLVVGACVAGCPMLTRACGTIGGETDAAMAALRQCKRAREVLGDDVGWGNVGCSNCESEGGGDPLNGGCHSSATWQMPVSGSRGRGSYVFHFTTPPGGKQTFGGGNVVVDGERISIPQTGSECTSYK